MSGETILLIAGIIFITTSVIIFTKLIPVKLYRRCKSLDPQLTLKKIIKLKLIHKIEPEDILLPYSIVLKEKLNITLDDLITHYRSKGNPTNVISTICNAKKNNIYLTYKTACSIELAGKNPAECIKKCINTQSFSTGEMECQTNDGTKIKLSVDLKIKGNIKNIIGGYNEEYLLNKVLNSIFDKIYSINSSEEIAIAKTQISREVLKENLDTGCAYDIKDLKIKITDCLTQ